jgi:ABC-2 type transport system ATP-binding protein
MSSAPEGPLPLAVRGVRKSFGAAEVLKGVTFEVLPGERFCLLGSNGAGKSTLMSILAGRRDPSAGEVRLYGLPARDGRLKRRRAVQLESAQFPFYAKVGEIVWLFSRLAPEPRDAAELFRRLRLPAGIYIRHLSKGQRQRLALLLALLLNPDFLLLDEPTSGLDPETRPAVWQLVSQHLAQGEARTLFFISHDLREAERWADRVAILHRGAIAASGTPDELRARLVGSRMRVVLTNRSGEVGAGEADGLPPGLVHAAVPHGADLVLYTDDPRELVQRLPMDGTRQVRIEPTTLEDVFLRVTTERVAHEPAAVA